tara:strand:- start:1420 stop:1953 length:534 start_codon:yes stop_codon:yes gene_type:complete
MYFGSFPLIVYDSVGDGNFKIVTNLLKRVAMRSKVKSNTLIFDTYDVKEGETPEMIANKLYDDPELHWVILYINNITDRYHQWPMNFVQFNSFLNEKYSNPNGIHHYEISQTSGDTSIKIDIGTDTTGYSEADLTTVTNREFEEERQDTLRSIRLLDFAYVDQFVLEFRNLMGASVL